MAEYIVGQNPGLKPEALRFLVQATLELAAIQAHMDATSSTKRKLKRCESALIAIAKIQGVPVKDFQETIKTITEEQRGTENEDEDANGDKPAPAGDSVVPLRK